MCKGGEEEGEQQQQGGEGGAGAGTWGEEGEEGEELVIIVSLDVGNYFWLSMLVFFLSICV